MFPLTQIICGNLLTITEKNNSKIVGFLQCSCRVKLRQHTELTHIQANQALLKAKSNSAFR